MGTDMTDADSPTSRSLRFWNKHAGSYDTAMGFLERVLFKDTRSWICRQARGAVLEVAIGTGLNLEHYRHEIALTGLEQSPQMLELARRRAQHHGRTVDLRLGDALALPFDDGRFDTVVCTFSLCEIPDNARAIAEMHRVLRPGGLLLLADHVASTSRAVRIIQRGLELITIPLGGEHFLRHPSQHLPAAGFEIERRERFTAGIVERLTARKPTPGATS
jgi:ubiquinone/menaquinone biosynthesis C-methylase UbiE